MYSQTVRTTANDLTDLWQQILELLRTHVGAESFCNWLEPVRFSHLDEDGVLHLIAPNQSVQEWLEGEYRELILDSAKQVNPQVRSIVFSRGKPAGPRRVPDSSPLQTSFVFGEHANLFNPKYTFDKFVVGSCNEFAHAAARAVATNPARAYNPLYIYGGVGMGKTHLMHAIGQQLKKNFAHLQVLYVSSEEFMNEMINSLRYDRMSTFQERFRSADALLVDDIQVLGTRERTQEEFFHTFNALHNTQKQIVISSDSLPKQVPGLVERLRSRFEWGLLADIQPPDLETKMAILDRKAEESSLPLPEDVRTFLATQMKSNIRELEGALTRLIAIASLSGSEITLAMAQQTLNSMLESRERQPTIARIQQVVSEQYRLEPQRLCEKTNARAVAFPRQIAMYLAKEILGLSLPEIGRSFGGKHHTTVLHAVQKIEGLRQRDTKINNLIHKLTERINSV